MSLSRKATCKKVQRSVWFTFLISLSWVGAASGLTIQLDYSADTFVSSNSTAQAAMNAAAADISSAITSTLSSITAPDRMITGTAGGFSTSFDWMLSYRHPETTEDITYDPPLVPADTVTIFVGGYPMPGTTMGKGSTYSVDLGVLASGVLPDYPGSVADAENQSNAIYSRGGGPIIGNRSGNAPDIQGETPPYSLDYGSIVGSISFDTEETWHFDHTSPVADGKVDFYTVAVHELLHAIGFGTSASWDSLVSGSTWAGPAAIALNGGSGASLIELTSGHIASGIQSPRLSDSVMQEVIMDPSLTTGERKEITLMDLAFLQDIGWMTVPEPSSTVLLLSVLLSIFAHRRYPFGGVRS